MDRLIALLAALVGLIALAGAVLIEIHGQNDRIAVEAQIAELKSSMGLVSQQPVAPAIAAAPSDGDADVTQALLALQDRIDRLEGTLRDQAVVIGNLSPSPLPAPVEQTAAMTSEAAPATTGAASAITADGPTDDCIPLGTRFMAQAGEGYLICKTKVAVNVTAVTDGTAVIDGAGPISAGGFGKFGFDGCTIMVFSADSSGYAEMRVTCS